MSNNYNYLYKDITTHIEECKYYDDLYLNFYSVFSDITPKRKYNLSVLILSNPCNGFGDIIFAMKFANFIRDTYRCFVRIATTQPQHFITLGEDKNNLYEIKSKIKEQQCRRFARLDFYYNNQLIDAPTFDLIFVAPLTADFDPDYNDIKKLVPYANKFNTYFLSEYNDDLSKPLFLHTGVGEGRYGLLFTDTPRVKPLPFFDYPYSVIYISERVSGYMKCIENFIAMLGEKYNDNNFEIVLPLNIINDKKSNINRITKVLFKYFNNVIVKMKNFEDKTYSNKKSKKVLPDVYLRFDVFPLPNKDMISLFTYSVRDILLTGDQSITDAISCCYKKKNIFYQIAPWKRDFAKNLEKELPNKYLAKSSTSCGGLKAIEYESDYTDFRNEWDFRVLSREKLDPLFYLTDKSKFGNTLETTLINMFIEIVLERKSVNSVLDRWKRLFSGIPELSEKKEKRRSRRIVSNKRVSSRNSKKSKRRQSLRMSKKKK